MMSTFLIESTLSFYVTYNGNIWGFICNLSNIVSRLVRKLRILCCRYFIQETKKDSRNVHKKKSD